MTPNPSSPSILHTLPPAASPEPARPGNGHKSAHHGKTRAIHFGPKARATLVEFIKGDHSPPEGMERRQSR
ncbi:MAG: hypothetical protein K8U57_04450 [Planctomycetes bacterium]|nr:hypothetical protein [Planctomycetota bacterium]